MANAIVIFVLERRREIGLRRALEATRGHIRTQFLAEALLLSLLGGIAGVVLGLGVTAAFAVSKGWPVSVPPVVLTAGLAATVLIGAVARLWPAVRVARTPPTEALQSWGGGAVVGPRLLASGASLRGASRLLVGRAGRGPAAVA